MNKYDELRANFTVNRMRYKSKKEFDKVNSELTELIAAAIADYEQSKWGGEKPTIVCLCGSTKFKEQFIFEQKRLTLEGKLVISVGLFGHSNDNEAWGDGVKEMLDELHKRKIDLSDEIFVINVGGYIGSSTKSEIEYAINSGKKVDYLDLPEAYKKGGEE